MFASIFVYAGLLAASVGVVSLLKPLRWLRIRSRARAAGALAAGIVLVVCGMVWPAPLRRVEAERSALDHFMPAYQFSEFHEIQIHAAPANVYRAVREVTADEIFLFRTLTWIRDPHRSLLRGQAAPSGKPLLDVATRSKFRVLAEQPGREIVLGTVVVWDGVSRIHTAEEFRGFDRPGNAISAINFLVRDDGGGWCTLSTETRVFAMDARTHRRFARYWRMIYPGSSMIRYFWLRAVRKRAEAALPPHP